MNNTDEANPNPEDGPTDPASPPPFPPNNSSILSQDEASTAHEGEQSTANSSPRPRFIEWLQAVTNAVLAMIGIIAICIYGGQLGAMKGQLKEMHDSGIDTHTLAQQAITQATQTTNLATQTTNLVAAMGRQADSTHDLAIQAVAQAKAAQDTAMATQKSAEATNNSMRIAQQQLLAFEETEAAQLIVNITPAQEPDILQAQIHIPSDSIIIDWDVEATNVGPTIAKALNFSAAVFDIANTNGTYTEPPGRPFSRLAPTPSPIGKAIRQNDTEHFKFTQQIPGWQSVVDRKHTIVIYMQVSYMDIFNRPQFAPTCVYFDLSTKGFVRCP